MIIKGYNIGNVSFISRWNKSNRTKYIPTSVTARHEIIVLVRRNLLVQRGLFERVSGILSHRTGAYYFSEHKSSVGRPLGGVKLIPVAKCAVWNGQVLENRVTIESYTRVSYT